MNYVHYDSFIPFFMGGECCVRTYLTNK